MSNKIILFAINHRINADDNIDTKTQVSIPSLFNDDLFVFRYEYNLDEMQIFASYRIAH